MGENIDMSYPTRTVSSGEKELHLKRTILRLPAVKIQSGLSRSTIYARIAAGLWPRPIGLGGHCVGWPADEVAKINSARIAGLTDGDIRVLVKQLETDRKNTTILN